MVTEEEQKLSRQPVGLGGGKNHPGVAGGQVGM